ncbi:MAG: phospho-N-acetylmuramoyl-pentapeptide-transferase [Patescibacteria group bacterium]
MVGFSVSSFVTLFFFACYTKTEKMLSFLVFLLLSFIVSMLWAPLLISLLFKFNLRRRSKEELDEKVEKHAKKTGTPVMGGILIVVTVLVLNLLFNNSVLTYPLLVTLFMGGVLGGIDDLFNTLGHKNVRVAVRRGITPVVSFSGITWSLYQLVLLPWHAFKEAFRAMGSYRGGFQAHEKFLAQCFIAGGVSFWVYYFFEQSALWLPLLGVLEVGFLYPVLLTFSMVFFSNAFSITDGLDGLSGGTHSLAFLALGIIGLVVDKPGLAIFAATLVGVELAFLYFNIYPARFQMSDVGTLPLGMVFALLAFLLNRELILPIVGVIFVVELLSSFLQVWSVKLRDKRIFKIAPLHHHFEALGWPETKITERAWVLSAVFAVMGILVALL